MHVAEPFKKANRMFHPEDTVVDVAGVPVGGKRLAVMAGPCSVESREQVIGHCPGGEAGRGQHPPGRRLQAPHLPLRLPGPEVRGAGAPDAPPGRPPGCPSSARSCPPLTWMCSCEKVDLIQVGARNMQNFDLLRQLGTHPQAHPAQARPLRHHRGVAHER